jgi:hypothetical protein
MQHEMRISRHKGIIMSDSFQTLRQKVLQAVEEQRHTSQPTTARHPQVLAEFLQLQLSKLGMSEGQLAQQIDMSDEQVRMLLLGSLPLSILSEDLLQRIASAVQSDVKLLGIILNRTDSKQTFTR